MKYEEYMMSLTEQIRDTRAKHLVAEEIKNHIEEQTECYEADGMSHEMAVEEAVRQMGNPVETGIELNKIHKPKMPWAMLGIVTVLMLAAIVMQAVIFAEGGNALSSWANLPKTIVYNCLSLAVILGLLYMDYNFIAKYAYVFYGVYIVGQPIFLIVVEGFAEVGKITSYRCCSRLSVPESYLVTGTVAEKELRFAWLLALLGFCGARSFGVSLAEDIMAIQHRRRHC